MEQYDEMEQYDKAQLIKEQDQEYQRCLIEDLERIRKNEQKELEKIQAEEEALVMQQSWFERQAERFQVFASNEPHESTPDVIHFKFVISPTHTWKRRFLSSDTITTLLEFVDCHPCIPPFHFSKVRYYNQYITNEHPNITINEWFGVKTGRFTLSVLTDVF
jgi:hypothetical protein